MCTGPTFGLRLFEKMDQFQVLVCGGDGSAGWVLTEMDKLNLHKKDPIKTVSVERKLNQLGLFLNSKFSYFQSVLGASRCVTTWHGK